MTHLLELHKEKKLFLIEFSDLSARELSKFANSDFEGIDSFYYKRERILEILQFIDQKISLQMTSNKEALLNFTEKQMIETVKTEIKDLAQIILKQDMDILSLIEATKSSIIKELQSLKKNKKSVSSYKTKVDHHQIDEEA